MIVEGTNLGQPVYRLFLNETAGYVERVEQLAAAVRRDEPLLAQLLEVLAASTAQSAKLISRFWPGEPSERGAPHGAARSAS